MKAVEPDRLRRHTTWRLRLARFVGFRGLTAPGNSIIRDRARTRRRRARLAVGAKGRATTSSRDGWLYSDGGADTLTGEPGADHFVYKATTDSTVAVSGQDVITDFSHAQGDRIDVSAISPSFTLVAAFTHAADQLIEVAKPGGYLVEGDVNGDGKPDFAIMVDTSAALVASDFIL